MPREETQWDFHHGLILETKWSEAQRSEAMAAKPARLPSPPCLQKASALTKRPLRPSLSPGPGGIDGTGSQGKWEDGSSPGMKYNEVCPVPRATGTRVTPTGSPTQAVPWPTRASRLKRLASPIPVGAATRNPTLLRKEDMPCPAPDLLSLLPRCPMGRGVSPCSSPHPACA